MSLSCVWAYIYVYMWNLLLLLYILHILIIINWISTDIDETEGEKLMEMLRINFFFSYSNCYRIFFQEQNLRGKYCLWNISWRNKLFLFYTFTSSQLIEIWDEHFLAVFLRFSLEDTMITMSLLQSNLLLMQGSISFILAILEYIGSQAMPPLSNTLLQFQNSRNCHI